MSSATDTPPSHRKPGPRDSRIVRLSDYRRKRTGRVFFNRPELSQLMALYSTHVAEGDWRDYAIDHSSGIAVFSVFRHTHDRPLFSIAKIPLPRGIEFAVFDTQRRIARSASLTEAIACLKIPRLKVVSD